MFILQSFEDEKKQQKSALKHMGNRYVCVFFVSLVVAYLSVAFRYQVCKELFAGDKYATAFEFHIIHVFFGECVICETDNKSTQVNLHLSRSNV